MLGLGMVGLTATLCAKPEGLRPSVFFGLNLGVEVF
ncbi:hypothetical protein [Marinobacter changyiensis]